MKKRKKYNYDKKKIYLKKTHTQSIINDVYFSKP